MKYRALTILIILFSTSVLGAFVGTNPGAIQIDNAEPGDQIDREIHVTTDLTSNFTVDPRAVQDTSERTIRQFDSSVVSEQGSSNWFEFEQIEIDPNTTETVTLPNGNRANVQGTFEASLTLPQDAEPGLHRGRISLDPEIATNQETPGARTIGQSRVSYTINVQGEADRSIIIQDVRSFRLDEDLASIEILLTNTGTVTTSTENFEINVYNSRGEDKAELSVNSAEIAPGESRWVDTSWVEDSRIEGGSYEIDGEVNYITGSSYASGSFSLPEFNVVETRPEDSPAVDSSDDKLPIWLVLMILVVLGVLMWSFEIDPVWIFAIMGVMGISAFILLTEISNILLAGVLIPVALLLYLGV